MTDNDFRWLPVSASAPRQCLLWILKWEREDWPETKSPGLEKLCETALRFPLLAKFKSLGVRRAVMANLHQGIAFFVHDDLLRRNRQRSWLFGYPE